MTTQTTSTTIYASDLAKVKAIRDRKHLKNIADVIRIAIGYCEAQGVFT